MTCHHKLGDPNCSNSRSYYEPYEYIQPKTPDANNFTILAFQAIGNFFILQVKYPNCSSCAYEGIKTLVYRDIKVDDLVFWKTIDPHFNNKKPVNKTIAPSPVCRFHGTPEGWNEALEYCKWRSTRK